LELWIRVYLSLLSGSFCEGWRNVEY
jgi:hypothetical protein